MAPTALQAHPAGRQVELVVDHEDLFRRNLEELRQWTHGLARAVHEGNGAQQPHVDPVDHYPANRASELSLLGPMASQCGGDGIYRPESGVMAGPFVLLSGITQSHDQLDTHGRGLSHS